MLKKILNNTDFVYFLSSISIFYYLFGHTLEYGRQFDDFMLESTFLSSPGDAKLYSSFLYAKFHFYPIYFLSHELDNFLTFIYSILISPIPDSFFPKNTNLLLHIFNSYLVFVILKMIFSPKELQEKVLLYFSSLIFLLHPIGTQTVFNITTRNESLALFFSLLTFIYSFKYFKSKRTLDLFFVVTLYFFALSSKLNAVTFVAIIPSTIYLINYKSDFNLDNLIKTLPIFLTLMFTFVIFYYVRSNFVNDYIITFYSNFDQLISNSLIGFKFYIRGLFFPYEHIYLYADNYNQNYKIIIFLFFVLFLILSFYILFKFNDPFLIIIIIWISATLSMPILFNLIEKGFPLISKLAERYQYSSIPSVSILFAWLSIKFYKKKFFNITVLTSMVVILILFSIIKKDRSYVYEYNKKFFVEAYNNSPENYYHYSFTVPFSEAIVENNEKIYLFNLYQLHSLYPKRYDYILAFVNYYKKKNNLYGEEYFLNYYKNETKYDPPIKFKLAKYFYNYNEFDNALIVLDEIFSDFDKLIEEFKDKSAKVKITDPEIDDVYFLKGLVLEKLNRTEDALGNFMLATVHNPMHATALYNSSILLKKLGQNELAQKHFQDAIKLNPFLRETVNQIIQEKNFNDE